jgi:hypothetical protein
MAERSQESGAAMGQPVTRYARAGDLNIAYQVVGDGPVDLVLAYGLASNIGVFWEEPSFAAFLPRHPVCLRHRGRVRAEGPVGACRSAHR